MTARQGPRPLPLHLAVALATWTGSHAALPYLRSGSPSWKGPLGEASALLQALAGVDPEALAEAVAAEGRRRIAALMAGIEAYRRHPYARDLPEAPAVWREGGSALLDYRTAARKRAPKRSRKRARAEAAPAILVVPSLINRYTVLDLSARASFLRWLAERGCDTFVVDWGAPGETERSFTLTDYIAGRLEAALAAVIEETGRRPLVAGYCMGGNLALALALRRQRDLAGLLLLATPWDFHVENRNQALCLGACLPSLEPLLSLFGTLPVDSIQALFAGLDPLLVARKFMAFSRLDPASPRAEAFVALEDWLNDGIALAAPVARECLGRWYGANTPGRGDWRVAGEAVEPTRLDLPTLVVVPDQDRIVPPASAGVLAQRIPGADAINPRAGHIGMMASGRAPDQVWVPILTWVKERAAASC